MTILAPIRKPGNRQGEIRNEKRVRSRANYRTYQCEFHDPTVNGYSVCAYEPACDGKVHAGTVKRPALKIISFNIRHGGGSRVTRIEEAIAGHAPDVVVLPEFRNNPAGATLRSWLAAQGHVHQSAGTTLLPAHNSVLVAS